MKSLQTVQKTFRVFQILAKVFMILNFVWAGLALLGLVCALVWSGGGAVLGADRELLLFLTETGGLEEMSAVLLTDTVLALVDGTLLALTYRYLKGEQADGTPFTRSGADRIRRLGVKTIVFPLVGIIVSAAVCAICGWPTDGVDGWNDLPGVTLGVALILTSLVFRYGAELEEKAGSVQSECPLQ